MLAVLTLAFLSAPPQQLAVRSREVFDPPVVELADSRVIVNYPDGGAVASLVLGERDVSEWDIDGLVVRVGADGKIVWRSDFPIATDSQTGPSIECRGLAVLDDGAIIAAFSDAPSLVSVLLKCFDPDGTLRWEREINAAPGAYSRSKVGALGATDGGDALLHFEWRDLDAGDPSLGVSMRIDGTTGADVWRLERTIVFQPNEAILVQAVVRDGALYFLEERLGTGFHALKIDGAGTTVYDTGGVLTSSSFRADPTFAVGDDGSFTVGQGVALSFLDPAGQIVNEVTTGYRHVRARPGGGVVALRAGAVDAYSATGALLWTRSASNALDLVATDDGGARVFRWNGSAPNLPLLLTRIGGDGQGLGSLDLTVVGRRPNAAIAAPVLPDGSMWCALSYRDFSSLVATGSVVGVAFDSVDSTVECNGAALNSSGQTGRIQALGDGAASGDDVVLYADRLPAFQTVLFLNSREPGSMPMVGGGAGTLCLGGSVNRYLGPGEVSFSTPLGEAWLRLSLPNSPDGAIVSPVLAGETWYYQAWHRDVVGGAQTTNLTGAVAVTYR